MLTGERKRRHRSGASCGRARSRAWASKHTSRYYAHPCAGRSASSRRDRPSRSGGAAVRHGEVARPRSASARRRRGSRPSTVDEQVLEAEEAPRRRVARGAGGSRLRRRHGRADVAHASGRAFSSSSFATRCSSTRPRGPTSCCRGRPLLRGAPPPLTPPLLIGAAACACRKRAGAVRRLHEVVHVHHPRERRPVPMLKVQGRLVGKRLVSAITISSPASDQATCFASSMRASCCTKGGTGPLGGCCCPVVAVRSVGRWAVASPDGPMRGGPSIYPGCAVAF